MIETLIIAIIVAIAFAIPIATIIAVIEDYIRPFIAAAILFVLVVGFVFLLIYGKTVENEQGPCFEYRTQQMYNSATKTMMPARVCVERGEWVR